MNVPTCIEGDTGDGKTTTAATSRGRIAIVDIDAQAQFTFGRFPWVSPLAEMATDHATLKAGSPAIWHTTNPMDFEPARILAFIKASGIGHGDTLIIDPISEYFGQILDAADAKPGQKGEKVNWSAIKRPYKRTLVALRNAEPDIIVTVRLGLDYDAAGVPTGKVRPEGDKRKTPYEFPFIFRMGQSGKDRTMTCMKQKGGFFETGEVFRGTKDSPIILRDIYEARGVYAALDSLVAQETEDPVVQSEAAGAVMFNESGRAGDIKDALLAAITKDLTKARSPENIRLFNSLPEADKAEVKALVAKLSGGR